MAYTLGEAAKATGKSKSTISKALKSGKISGVKNENGAFHIDPAELHRVYPPVSGNTQSTVEQRTPLHTEETVRIKELETLLEAVEARISDKDDLLSELRADRDHWRQQANALLEDNRRTSALLNDERQKSPGPKGQPQEPQSQKSFLHRLFRRVDER